MSNAGSSASAFWDLTTLQQIGYSQGTAQQ
jgi:hypothetical protein